MNLTKQDLYNTKWDASEWTTEMKIKWQEKMFELGFYWWCGNKTCNFLENSYYHLWRVDCVITHSDCLDFQDYTQMYYTDIFPEAVCTSETSVDGKQYNYIKCEFKHAGEAITAYCEGTKLYWWSDTDEDYVLCCTPFSVLMQNTKDRLYTREETPWYEQISEDKPVYCLSVNRCLTKLTGVITKHGASRCKPLTQEQVDDIVKTQERWLCK